MNRACWILWVGGWHALGLSTHAQITGPLPGRFEDEVASFKAWDVRNSPPDHAALFVGDAGIRLWPTRESFPDWPIINRGFDGAHLSDVNHYFSSMVAAYRPSVIVLCAGEDDVADGKTPRQVLEDYRRFLSHAETQLPGTPVIFLAIRPSPGHWALWPKMREANEMIAEATKAHAHRYYADVATPLLDQAGKPRAENFAKGGVHLGRAGYRLWSESVRPILRRVMNQRGSETPPRPQAGRQVERILNVPIMQYLLYVPPEYENDPNRAWPLVVFLHGSGERGTNLDDVKKHGPPLGVQRGDHFPFVLVSPQCSEGVWWQPRVVLRLIDELEKTLRIDADRVYLTGLSMGGYGTWQTAALAPERFAAIAPICGGGDVEEALRLKDLPIWAFHGEADPVVPVARSREMVAAVERAGGKPRLTVYPGVKHDSWTRTYANPDFFSWLLSQRRSPGNRPSSSDGTD